MGILAVILIILFFTGRIGKNVNKSNGPRLSPGLFFLLAITGTLPIALIIMLISSSLSKKNRNTFDRANNFMQNQRQQFTNMMNNYGMNGMNMNNSNYRNGANGMNGMNGMNGANGMNGVNGYYTGYTNGAQNYQRQINNAYANNMSYQNMYGGNPKPNSYGLPSSSKKRSKIVKKFSDRYDMYLDDDTIQKIVDSSYMSSGWAREICYMDQKYDTIYSWFANMNPWLKVYLSAFRMHTIASDFEMQERIVYETFDQVFSDICNDPSQPIDYAISRINEKYFTNFDDTTFMIAYRYMESKGKHFPINFGGAVINGNQDIDDLLHKYEQTQRPLQ